MLYINGRTEAYNDERIELDENFAQLAAELNISELAQVQIPQEPQFINVHTHVPCS
jgi:hypothetical protein